VQLFSGATVRKYGAGGANDGKLQQLPVQKPGIIIVCTEEKRARKTAVAEWYIGLF